MFVGHLDSISRTAIEGWAADDANPDATVDISVFVDGHKLVQIACNRPRDDLKGPGGYGNGRHGFNYRFPEPFPSGRAVRVSVFITETGRPLGRGDCLVTDSGIQYLPPALKLPNDEPVMMRPPKDPRSLFELLSLYDDDWGIYPLLSRLDFTSEKPRDVYYTVFGMNPDPGRNPLPVGSYNPREHLHELLHTSEFQANLLSNLLQAYDDKQRLIFVHIPKCAGTDLSNKLKGRFPWINVNIMDPAWTTREAMLRHLARLVSQLRFADTVYVCGHGGLDYYAQNRLIRPMDRAFTIVRHPFDVIVSQVNYVLTRLESDAERGEIGPDTAAWLPVVGVDELPTTMSEDFVKHASKRILQNKDIVRPNSMCFWLAGDGAGADTALANLAGYEVEVTDTNRYGEWLNQRWRTSSTTRDNASKRFITPEALPNAEMDYLLSICEEDMKLYRTIDRSLTLSGKVSVIGQELELGIV